MFFQQADIYHPKKKVPLKIDLPAMSSSCNAANDVYQLICHFNYEFQIMYLYLRMLLISHHGGFYPPKAAFPALLKKKQH